MTSQKKHTRLGCCVALLGGLVMLMATGVLPVDDKDLNSPNAILFLCGIVFLAIISNNRMPAIVDHNFAGRSVSVFESGAILIYLAEKTGRFMPSDRSGCREMLEWLFWQVGNLGPMAGQLSHFVNYAQGEHAYSHQRYLNEYNRCLGVLERRLERREYILGEFSIADMASWPWVLIAKALGQPLDEFPSVSRWRQSVKERQAVQRGVVLGKEFRRDAPPSEEERQILFNQRARVGHNN